MKAMIFAAGLGTRLRPLTDARPKALVEVGGKPLLGILTDKLRQAGITDITVNVHHFPDQIIQYLQGSCISAHISDERYSLLDTGGGLRKARPFLEGGGPFLTHNVDILSNLDFTALPGMYRPGSVATLIVSDRPSSRRLLFDDDMRLRGWLNTQTGEVRSPYPGLKPEDCRSYAFSGIQIISDRIFPLMETRPEEKFSIIDFYLSEAARQPIYGYAPKGLEVLDVGKRDSIAVAASVLERYSQELAHD